MSKIHSIKVKLFLFISLLLFIPIVVVGVISYQKQIY